MTIIAYLGQNVNDYRENTKDKIAKLALHCDKHPSQHLAFHSTYLRTIKETGEKVTIHLMICHECKKTLPTGKGCTTAVLPDFLYPRKHYSANEMEAVKLQEDEGIAVYDIETAASSYTVRRWLKELCEKAAAWTSTLRIIAIARKCAVSEITLSELSPVDVLRTLIDALPRIKSCGNILGAAQMWAQTYPP